MILATSTPPATAPAAAAGRGQIGRPVPAPPIEMAGPPDGEDPGAAEGFITVGSAPGPRPQTPAAGAAGPPATSFPPRPTPMQPGIAPPDGDGPPQPER